MSSPATLRDTVRAAVILVSSLTCWPTTIPPRPPRAPHAAPMGACTTLTSDIRRALVVRGGWDGHQPVTISDGFVPFLEERGFTVESSEDLAVYEEAERLAATDLIVQCWTMGTITREQSENLAAAVRAGT